jgi:HEPN domain-containing protein
MPGPKDKDVQAWIDASRYDLKTAAALLQSRRYVYVLFMCQQSLEKVLKAHVTRRTGELPPRIRNLVRLAELAGLDISEKEREFLERLSLYYIQTRYPSEIQDFAKTVTRSVAIANLKQMEVLWKRFARVFARKR